MLLFDTFQLQLMNDDCHIFEIIVLLKWPSLREKWFAFGFDRVKMFKN
jgi:hypothetical protein